jgi:copper chaperone CopZ
VARALESVAGVKSVEVSYSEKSAVVLADKSVTVGELCQALTKEGFTGEGGT